MKIVTNFAPKPEIADLYFTVRPKSITKLKSCAATGNRKNKEVLVLKIT